MKSPLIGQLKLWGVKYNKIFFNKPNADIYIDDKALTPASLIYNNFKKYYKVK